MNIQGEKQHNLPTKTNVEITNLQLKVLIIFMKKKKKKTGARAIEYTIIYSVSLM